MTESGPDHRMLRARKLAELAGRRLEVWTGDAGTPQRYTCPDHPGKALTWAELRALGSDPAAHRFATGPTPPGGVRGDTP